MEASLVPGKQMRSMLGSMESAIVLPGRNGYAHS
jgi:hypothetical protein